MFELLLAEGATTTNDDSRLSFLIGILVVSGFFYFLPEIKALIKWLLR